MKKFNLFLVLFALALLQCNSPKVKFIKGEYSCDCPIKDLITEGPALDDKTIIPIVLEDDALKQASNVNYIFNQDDVYKLIEAVDPEWQGALPYTLLIEPGGKIIYKKQDMIDPFGMKKLIVDSKYIGRYY